MSGCGNTYDQTLVGEIGLIFAEIRSAVGHKTNASSGKFDSWFAYRSTLPQSIFQEWALDSLYYDAAKIGYLCIFAHHARFACGRSHIICNENASPVNAAKDVSVVRASV